MPPSSRDICGGVCLGWMKVRIIEYQHCRPMRGGYKAFHLSACTFVCMFCFTIQRKIHASRIFFPGFVAYKEKVGQSKRVTGLFFFKHLIQLAGVPARGWDNIAEIFIVSTSFVYLVQIVRNILFIDLTINRALFSNTVELYFCSRVVLERCAIGRQKVDFSNFHI